MNDLKEAIQAWFEDLMADRRKLIAIGAVVLALAVAVSLMVVVRSNARNVRYQNCLNDGWAYMDQMDYENAIGEFEAAYAVKETEEAAIALAQAYFAAGLPDKALEVLDAHLEEHKSSGAPEALRAQIAGTTDTPDTLNIAGQQVSPTTTALVLTDKALTHEDLEAIGTLTDLSALSLSGCSIRDLSFLQGLTKLTSLTLTGNDITDLSPLSAMSGLRTLYLDNNEGIKDFSPLYGCTGLTTLSIKGIELTKTQLDTLESKLPSCAVFSDKTIPETLTLGGVSFTTDVTELSLGNRGITDISVLAKCPKLTRIDLSGNIITDLSPLEGLSGLTWLNLRGNNVSDISPLGVLVELTYLDLEDNNLSSINDLTGLTELKELYLSGNAITNFAALKQLTALEKLNLSHCGLTDKGLGQIPMTAMKELDIRSNSALSGKTVLAFAKQHAGCTVLHDEYAAEITLGSRTFSADEQAVDASYSSVIDLSPVVGFTNLKSLFLNGNGISDFSPLKALTGLQTLELRSTGLSDCTVLAGMSGLTALNLADNSLKDVYPLSACTGLTKLTLSGNRGLTDAAPLKYCTELTELYLDNTGITDVSPLRSLTKLQTLYLDGCSISDFTQLHGMSSLRTLYIIDTGITGEQLYALQQALPNCSIYAGDVVPVIPPSELNPSPEGSPEVTPEGTPEA